MKTMKKIINSSSKQANIPGEAPYTLVYNRDPPIPIHKLIKVVEPYMGENTLGKRIEVKSFPFNSCKNIRKNEGKPKEVL